MNIQVDPTSSNLASAMLNSKIRPRAVVGYGVKIFHPSPPNYVTRSPGTVLRTERKMARRFAKVLEEEIQEAFYLVNTKTTIPLRVGEGQWIYTSTLRVTTFHLPFGE